MNNNNSATIPQARIPDLDTMTSVIYVWSSKTKSELPQKSYDDLYSKIKDKLTLDLGEPMENNVPTTNPRFQGYKSTWMNGAISLENALDTKIKVRRVRYAQTLR